VKYQEVTNKSISELYDSLFNLKKELLNIRIQRATGTAPNTSLIRKSRRDVARIKTRLGQLSSVQTKNK
jgi:large subunit ribosomal protein L29